jgi:hypothetical protein
MHFEGFSSDDIPGTKVTAMALISKRIRKVLRRVWRKITLQPPPAKVDTLQSLFIDLTRFAAAFEVNRLKLGDEYLWPYFRQRLWVQLYGIGRGKMSKALMSPESMQLGRLSDVPLQKRDVFKERFKAIDIEEITPGDYQVDFLFMVVTNASEQVLLEDGRYYHRITDPFYEASKTVGSSLKIEMLKVKSPKLERSHKYYHPVQYVLPPVPTGRKYHLEMDYPVGLLKKLNRRIPVLHYTHSKFRRFVDWEMHTREYYMDMLRRIGPKYLLLNGFHYHAPLISAAHALGIRTVDIQHGIQVGYNPLYNDWSEMPPEGYQAVVDRFFVWGEKEAASIHQVFKGAKHSPVITGFPWLSRQLELSSPLKEEYKELFSRYRVRVLLILQNQEVVPELFKELIASSPQDYLWVVRHHPKGRRFKIEDFGPQIHENVLLDGYFDQIVLAQLFQHTDVVVSEGSTVAIEADDAGLQNFIFGDKGYENYKAEIQSGAFSLIRDAREFYSAIDVASRPPRGSRVMAYSKRDLSEVFRELLNETKCQNEKDV